MKKPNRPNLMMFFDVFQEIQMNEERSIFVLIFTCVKMSTTLNAVS